MYHEGIVDFNDYQIKYYQTGEGPQTLLFLHGMANAAQVWFPMMEILSSKYVCLAIDWPGCGKSSKGDYSFSYDFYFGVMKKVVAHFKLKEFVLVGHSMGAQWASHYAIHYPRQVASLHLIAPAGFEIYSYADQQMVLNSQIFLSPFISDLNMLLEGIKNSFYSNHIQGQQYMKLFEEIYAVAGNQFLREMNNRSTRSMMMDPVLPVAPQIMCDTSIYFGMNDMLIPNKLLHHTTTSAIGELAKQAIPNSELFLYERSGHFLHIERSSEIATLIMEKENNS